MQKNRTKHAEHAQTLVINQHHGSPARIRAASWNQSGMSHHAVHTILYRMQLPWNQLWQMPMQTVESGKTRQHSQIFERPATWSSNGSIFANHPKPRTTCLRAAWSMRQGNAHSIPGHQQDPLKFNQGSMFSLYSGIGFVTKPWQSQKSYEAMQYINMWFLNVFYKMQIGPVGRYRHPINKHRKSML